MSQAIGSLAEGIQSGVGLRNALLQRDLLKAQTQLEQAKAQQQSTMVPMNIGGQIYQVPQDQAAGLASAMEERKLMGRMMFDRMGLMQQYKQGNLTGSEQNRLDAVQSALPIHNAAMGIYQAYQAAQAGDTSKFNTAMTMAKSKLAGTSLAPLAEQAGNDPANLPALYDMVTTQGALEQNKLSTGSIRPPSAEEIKSFKNTFHPTLATAPDVAYGQFKHFSDAYIWPAYNAGLAHLNQAQDQQGNLPPGLDNVRRNLQQQMKDTEGALYQMPGMGPKGTLPPEIQAIDPAMRMNGAPMNVPPGIGGTAIPAVAPGAGTGLPTMTTPPPPVQGPGVALPTVTPHPQPQRRPLGDIFGGM